MSRPKDFPIPKPETLTGDVPANRPLISVPSVSPVIFSQEQRDTFTRVTGITPDKAFLQLQPNDHAPAPLIQGMSAFPSIHYTYHFDLPASTQLSSHKPFQLLQHALTQLNIAPDKLSPYDAYNPQRQHTDIGFRLTLNTAERATLFQWFAQNREKVQQFLDGTGPLPSLPKRGGSLGLPASVTLAAVGDAPALPSSLQRAANDKDSPTRTA